MTEADILALINLYIVDNGNNEITANVLRPILQEMLSQPNDKIGDLGDLDTTDQTNVVNAINEVLNGISTGFEIHTGTADPNVTPPGSFSIGDWYVRSGSSLYQYNGDIWVLQTSLVDPMFKSVYDPTNIEGDVFDMDNMVEGTSNKILTEAERTILSDTSGTNTGDQDLSGLQPKPSEGQFVDGDKTKLDNIENYAQVNVAPIPTNYADLAELISEQGTQLEDYIYEVTDGSGFTGIDSGKLWVKYNGGTAGTEDDYSWTPRGGSSSVLPIEKTGSTIVFTERANYNYTTPSSSNIVIDNTGAIKDTVVALFYNGSTEPTITGADVIVKSGRFIPDVLLIYWFVWFDDSVTINIQRDMRLMLNIPELTATPSDEEIVLTWDAVSNANDYSLLFSLTDDVDTATEIYSGSLLTYTHTGRTNGVTNYYWLKAIDTTNNYIDSPYDDASGTSQLQTILFEDDFTGLTIDAGKWIQTTNSDVSLTQNDELIYTALTTKASGASPTKVNSISYFDSSIQDLVLKVDLVKSANISDYFGITLRNAAANNLVVIESVASPNTSLQSSVYKSGVSDNVTHAVNISNSFKIVLSGGNASFYYWSGSWVLIRTTTFNNDDYQIQLTATLITNTGTTHILDDLVLTDYDFATLNP